MSVTIEDEDGKSDSYREVINTVRVIVFDNASTVPRLDVNRVFRMPGGETGTKFTVKTETSRNNDKLVMAIVNEPAGASQALAGMSHPMGWKICVRVCRYYECEPYGGQDHPECR